MKACFKCHAVKPLTDFYKNSGMPDGHVNKCKECNKKDVLRKFENMIGSEGNFPVGSKNRLR